MTNCFGRIHTIRSGDTFWTLSQIYGVSLQRIIAANPGVDPNRLQIGQQVCIPGECAGFVYTIRAGDTFWLIAQRFGTTVEELISANPGVNFNNLQIGQLICVPVEEVTPPRCEGTLYTVRTGDTLTAISQKFGVTIQAILAANPEITNPNHIEVLQQICIPTGEVIPTPNRLSLTYMFGGTTDYYLNLIARTKNSLTTVCPDSFELTDNGNLIVVGQNKLNAAFINNLHGQGIKVVPFLANHWDRAKGEAALNNREVLSSQIAEAVAQYNLDGVDVDIENVNHLFREQYTDFVRLLRQKLPGNKIVSVAVAANPNGWTTGWHGSYDYPALAKYADYLMIMNYDESFQGGPEGPVSSANFFNRSIQFALNQGVPKEKIVVGVPFFGRFWKTDGSIIGAGLAAADVEFLLKNYTSTYRYDIPTQSAFAEVIIRPGEPEPTIWGGRRMTAGTYHIWYDDPRATRYKLNVINGYGVLGAGSWALGQEIVSIWDFWTHALNEESIVPTFAPPVVPHPAPMPEPIPLPGYPFPKDVE